LIKNWQYIDKIKTTSSPYTDVHLPGKNAAGDVVAAVA
jgi:hypothetical protein